MPIGDIGAVIDSLEFEEVFCEFPWILHVSGDVYVIAHQGGVDEGWIRTVSIAADGQIGNAVIDSYEFDPGYCYLQQILHVSGDVFAIVYKGVDGDGWLKTVTIASDGTITKAIIDSLEFDAASGNHPRILNVAADVFAIVYQDGYGDGWIKTVSIAADGQIGNAVLDSYEFEPGVAQHPSIIHVSGDVFLIVCCDTNKDGWVYTVTIASNGTITKSLIDSYMFDDRYCTDLELMRITDNMFAVVYQDTGPSGWIRSIQVLANGQITEPYIDEFNFEGVMCNTAKWVKVGGNVYAIAYGGPDSDGWIKTVTIAANGTITQANIDSLEFDLFSCFSPFIAHVSGNVFAIAYKGVDGDGWLKTVDIVSVLPVRAQNLMMFGIG